MAWYNANWDWRIKITAQATEVDETISNFAYAFDLSNIATNKTNFWDNVKAAGADLRVTEGETTEVAIAIYDFDDTAETGTIFFKGTTNSSSNKDYYLYWGNASASAHGDSDTYGKYNVFSDFEKVWMLNETPTGTTDEIKNSKANSNHGTYQGTTTSKSVAGPLDMSAIDFEKDDANYILTGDWDFEEPHTIMAWGKVEATISTSGYFLGKWGGSTNQFAFFYHGTRQDLVLGFYYDATNQTWINSADSVIDTGVWRHYAVNKIGSTGTCFKDGVALSMDDSTHTGTGVRDSSDEVGIGGRSDGGALFDGVMAIVMYANTGFSTNKIATYYNNQGDQANFWVVGSPVTEADITSPVISIDIQALVPTVEVGVNISPTITSINLQSLTPSLEVGVDVQAIITQADIQPLAPVITATSPVSVDIQPPFPIAMFLWMQTPSIEVGIDVQPQINEIQVTWLVPSIIAGIGVDVTGIISTIAINPQGPTITAIDGSFPSGIKCAPIDAGTSKIHTIEIIETITAPSEENIEADIIC